ncbi:Peroxide stress-activated histidine kinase mak1 like protein [Verticillium longisporum]|uniref:histidine kinase n=1 Tax=Verticillium longisporum TaxID=100787 RepID=A0A8I2Z6G5_VERLO|nr:Peroxide stress-activated histidine kinase mak1 like protein [Verticillium longisporum]
MAERQAAPLRIVSESSREHETFKYYPALFTTTKQNPQPRALPLPQLETSPDTVLTALAQLAACQTGTPRALVSVFDCDYQHIIAEATPSLPLVPGLRAADHDHDLWLCGTAIPRRFGVCEAVLYPLDSLATEQGEGSTTLPVLCVPDLEQDKRFASTLYCGPGSPAKFFAGVPIRTAKGVNMGVLSVVDTVLRDDWSLHMTRVLRNLSKAITEHFEAGRAAATARRGARMNRGLGSFVEGAATISGWRHDDTTTAFQDDPSHEGALDAHQQDLQRSEEDRILEADEQARVSLATSKAVDQSLNESAYQPYSRASTPHHSSSSSRSSNTSLKSPVFLRPHDLQGNSVGTIFSKAANMIRESIEVEGCVFFDAHVRSFGGLSNVKSHSDHGDVAAQSASSSDALSSSGGENAAPDCRVLGFATTDASSINGARPSAMRATLPEGFMARLLRRYPDGKIFNFRPNGELRLTDSSEDDRLTALPGMLTHANPRSSPAPSRRRNHPWARHREGTAILRAFPGAQCVAFVPVRDSKKDRWRAGGFVYTNTPARVFTVAGELSFLTAFGVLAMSEMARLETLQADKAKSDALSSLSHELRSPLHGVILATELLHDTGLTVFQGNILHTIETCGRTLMDTLDHLLDFSKINKFTTMAKAAASTRPRSPESMRRPYPWPTIRQLSIEAGVRVLESNVPLDLLVEDVVESVFAGFNFQYTSMAQLGKHKKTRYVDAEANRRMDAHNAMQDFGSTQMTGPNPIDLGFNRVFVSLDLDPQCSWIFHTSPGAFRRVVLNLVGNALKYTQEGSIVVSLRQETSPVSANHDVTPRSRKVVLVVADTGKGIGEDYLQNHLFRAFAQEDHLSAGTGLGLSLVKQIVTNLDGKISVKSRVAVGTTVTVSVPLQAATNESEYMSDDDEFAAHVSDLKGLRVLLSGFSESHGDDTGAQARAKPGRDGFGRGLTEGICRDWLKMEVLSDTETLVPDVVLVAEHAMPDVDVSTFRNPPCVVVCANPLLAFDRSTSAEAAQTEGVFEFISQPLGPRKLAKILLLACQRWLAMQSSQSLDFVPAELHLPPTRPRPPPQGTADEAGAAVESPDLEEGKAGQPSTARPGVSSQAAASPVTERSQTPGSILSWRGRYVQTPPSECTVSLSETGEKARKFLLVDDNSINLRILSSYVKKLGRPLGTATNGLEAYEAYRTEPEGYSCIFMDISMPVMDGFEATRRIRTFEREKQLQPITIIALSGLASESAQDEAFVSGINLFLTKPVRLKDMASVLESRNLLRLD